GLNVKNLTTEELCYEMEWAGIQAEQARARIPGASQDSLDFSLLPDDLENKVRADLTTTLQSMDIPTWGRVRGRIIPTGTLLRLGISGIYNPFAGEGNIAGASTPQRYPTIMSHEMSHGYGFGDEGTCNFLAILACGHSKDPFLAYTGWLSYWSYLAVDLNKRDPVLYRMLRGHIPPGMRADLRANYNNSRRYAGAIARLGKKVNNAYLKAQGVKEGVQSYNRVVLLMAAWRAKYGGS
ncbi:MAG: DUF3810 family protein, partial [Bacteroidota bacterium]